MTDFVLDLLYRFTSRKFLLAVVGGLVVFGVDLSTAQITALTTIVIGFTAAEGYADVQDRKME